MEIKGAAFLGRRDMIVKLFGEERWQQFLDRVAQKVPFFKRQIFITTLIAEDVFLYFLDELLKEFFHNDPQAYWRMGEMSAEWSLTEGPFAFYLEMGDIEEFVNTAFPNLWKAYYTGGEIEAKLEGDTIHVRITGLKKMHPHYELTVMGYVARGLELFGWERVRVTRVKGFASRDQEIYYQFTRRK